MDKGAKGVTGNAEMTNEVSEQCLKKLKIKRRTAKAALTRISKVINNSLVEERPIEEVSQQMKQLQEEFQELIERHEEYAEYLDDGTFEDEEVWIEECQSGYYSTFSKASDYIRTSGPTMIEAGLEHEDQEELEERRFQEESRNVKQEKQAELKIEKPKLPQFGGDVREYFTFREDFKYMIENRYSKRDAMTLLRSVLNGKALQLIQGIGQDYDSAWDQLDNIYGDSRVVSDVVMQDIVKFRALKDEEDQRFCELVQLVQRSLNILKQAGRPYDMDNNHVLALIEKKLPINERRIWFRYLQSEKKVPTLTVLLEWLTEEMRSRLRASAAIRSGQESRINLNQVISSSVNSDRYESYKCWLCKNSTHWIDQCVKLKAMSQQERLKLMKENKACFSCLKRSSKSHNMSTCSKRKQCLKLSSGVPCRYWHHYLLHQNDSEPVAVTLLQAEQAILPVITVRAGNHCGSLLFDSGAQISLIRQDFAAKLQLKGKPISIVISKVGGEEQELNTFSYIVGLSAINGGPTQKVKLIAIAKINETTETTSTSSLAKKFGLNSKELCRGQGQVDILIGVDHAELHDGEIRRYEGLLARLSPFGWVIYGASVTDKPLNVSQINLVGQIDMTEFWTTESFGVMPRKCNCEKTELSVEEIKEKSLMEESCSQIGNQWVIPYPWKRDPTELPNNYMQVFKKLEAIEKRLLRNPELAKAYADQMKELCTMNFARKLSEEEIKQSKYPIYYICHHPVIKSESTSTPVRVVFNSSADFRGECLNEYWMKGPDLLNNLFGVLLRFRENKIGIIGDISKMYHRIRITEADQQVHRYFWRDFEINRKPDVYVKTVLTFGDKPAPAMAQIALRKTAALSKETYPEAVEIITANSYMDDICASVATKQEALKLTKEIDIILKSGDFTIKEWIKTGKGKTDECINLLCGGKEEKVLGVKWNPETDELSYSVKGQCKLIIEDKNDFTKRRILSEVSKIFDPIGFAAAFIINAKIGIQRLWKNGSNWDEKIPICDEVFWRRFFEDLENLKHITFPRSLKYSNDVRNPILCIFADASEAAFGACVYVRWEEQENKFNTRFVAAKSRVSPLKKLTIPRLELQAAVLATRLQNCIEKEVSLTIKKSVFFSDSTIVLNWIKGDAARFKPFVANRIAEIQDSKSGNNWNHISGNLNPADCVSRGVTVEQLRCIWATGPEFLRHPEDEWPINKVKIGKESDIELKKSSHMVNLITTQSIIDVKRFSDWRKLKKTIAYVLRFIEGLKKNGVKFKSLHLTAQEVRNAEMCCIRQAQSPILESFYKGEYRSLSPFLDSEKLLRVGGRIKKDSGIWHKGEPFLLPYEDPLSYVIASYVHRIGHYGVAATVARLRRYYWIIKAHKLVKKIKYRCITCRKHEHKTETQLMAEIPLKRIATCTPPFFHIACDYFGPITVKLSRNKRGKNYGVLFTCLNTRAVHLELAQDCTGAEFVQVLRRFFAIRGCPASIVSDNGTQMKLAANEILKNTSDRNIEWQFVTPQAPHHNGCAEALVKTCKRAIKQAIGEQSLTPFELYTVLLEIANLVNQRPIGRLINDPDDGSYISPNDIILGRASVDIPEGPFIEKPTCRQRVELVQSIIDSFWKQWSRDVLPLLVPRRKWSHANRNVRIDDVVVLKDVNEIRGKWKLGRITKVYPAADGKVRSVRVKTSCGEYDRPITKFSVIYPAEGYSDED